MEHFVMVFLAFCGGAFAAMIGALAAFIFCGITLLLGLILAISGSRFDFIGLVPFGVIFAPHISFVGGVAAAAFAKRMGYLESGKDIVTGLLSLKKLSVLAIGGIFGAIGYLLNIGLSNLMAGGIDTVALTVVIMALLTKLVFDVNFSLSGLIGVVPEGRRRFGSNAGGIWLEYMKTPSEKVMVAIVAGGLSAYVTQVMLQNPTTESVAAFFGFGLSATSLLFLQFGINIPVTHHITLVASYAVIASNGNILWGIAGAILAAFLGDILANTFFVYGDTHVDPPAMGIAAGSLLFLTVYPILGIYNTSVIIPLLIIIIAILYSIIQGWLLGRLNNPIPSKQVGG
jgi:hypothetical protein